MADAEIGSQIRSFLVEQKSQPFALEFMYNNRLYKTVMDASHNLDQIYVSNKCVGMEYDKGAFIGFIEANSEEKKCFDPILVTDPRGAPEPRTTAADVLQILKTKLGLLFPTDTPITIFDGAHKPETSSETAPTMISPFHVLRGGDAFYEKYGYVSPVINDLKHKLTTFTWGSCTEEAKKIIRDCTDKDYDPSMPLMEIMKTISWDVEVAFNNRSPRSLSYVVFRQFALQEGIPLDATNQWSLFSIWKFTLNRADPRWQRAETSLVFTKFTPLAPGGRRKTRKYRGRRSKGRRRFHK
jgi:hypothetical protein